MTFLLKLKEIFTRKHNPPETAEKQEPQEEERLEEDREALRQHAIEKKLKSIGYETGEISVILSKKKKKEQ